MIFAPLIELFFGKWECVVAEVPDHRYGVLIVCHKHTVTGRVTGYVSLENGTVHHLEPEVVRQHIKTYGSKA